MSVLGKVIAWVRRGRVYPDETVFRNIQGIVQDYQDAEFKEELEESIILTAAFFLALAAPNIAKLAELVFKDDKEG